MPSVQLTISARSDVGRVRSNNEDAFTVTDLHTGSQFESASGQSTIDVQQKGVLMVVSDGMGGHAAGEVASALVVESLRKSLATAKEEQRSIQRLIDSAVTRANADVLQTAQATRKRGMGATLTAILVYQTEAYVAEVGDSRAYLLRSGRLRQITRDQSFVQLLLDAGALTPEQAHNFPQKNIILQAMGLADKVKVAIGRLQLRRNDRLLLCSDGVTNKLNDEELGRLLAGPDPSKTCHAIIQLANERGGEDNITAIVAHLDGEGLPAPIANERVTATFEVLQEYAAPGESMKPHPTIAQAPLPEALPKPPPPPPIPEPPATVPNLTHGIHWVWIGVSLFALALMGLGLWLWLRG